MNLIDLEGNAYIDVSRVYIETKSICGSDRLMIKLRGDNEPVWIGSSDPEEAILRTVKQLIVSNLVRGAKALDLRKQFRLKDDGDIIRKNKKRKLTAARGKKKRAH